MRLEILQFHSLLLHEADKEIMLQVDFSTALSIALKFRKTKKNRESGSFFEDLMLSCFLISTLQQMRPFQVLSQASSAFSS
jgi:hypothetical protein